LRDLRINPCIGCFLCHTQHGKCSQKDDFLNIIFQKMIDSDAIYLVTPVYQGGVTSIMKNFMDRCEIYREGRLLKGKLCGGTAIGGYPGGGQELSLMQIQYFAHICAMRYVASWGNARSHLGGHCIAYLKGEIKDDKEGIISSKNVLLEMINCYVGEELQKNSTVNLPKIETATFFTSKNQISHSKDLLTSAIKLL